MQTWCISNAKMCNSDACPTRGFLEREEGRLCPPRRRFPERLRSQSRSRTNSELWHTGPANTSRTEAFSYHCGDMGCLSVKLVLDMLELPDQCLKSCLAMSWTRAMSKLNKMQSGNFRLKVGVPTSLQQAEYSEHSEAKKTKGLNRSPEFALKLLK